MSTVIIVVLTYAVASEAGIVINAWAFWSLCVLAGLWDGLTIRTRIGGGTGKGDVS